MSSDSTGKGQVRRTGEPSPLIHAEASRRVKSRNTEGVGGVCKRQTHAESTGESGEREGRSRGGGRSEGQGMGAKNGEGSRSFLSLEGHGRSNVNMVEI